MTGTLRQGHRAAAAVLLLAGGLGIAMATWISGDRTWAIAALAIYAVFAVGAYLWAGRATDIGAILRASGDERQRALDRDATAITGLVMSTVAVLGSIIEIGRTGNPQSLGRDVRRRCRGVHSQRRRPSSLTLTATTDGERVLQSEARG